MRANVFKGPDKIGLEDRPVPKAGPGEAVVKITLTTICGTDVHIMRGEYPVRKGQIIGHEPIGLIYELGEGVTGYKKGERVAINAITPCGQCEYCLSANWAQCGGFLGGWKMGNTIDGCQADYVKIPNAMANLTKIPDELSDEDVLFTTDIFSTGLSGAESAHIQVGDIVAVFGQGPIGLSAAAGAKLKGAALIITVDSVPSRIKMSQKMGADVVLNFKKVDPVKEIMKITNGRGVDVAIEAIGLQESFENCVKCTRVGGTISSLGVYPAHLGNIGVPLQDFGFGIADKKIVSTLCPGGKERMRRLISLVKNERVNLRQLITHRFSLDEIQEAYRIFSNQLDGVVKVAITP
ncbi:MAG: alcohol dehydrogenase catalytic domain-containing protein [Deltaproteobacteria bacterium]|nr:alcohol dehydrogenase catalytic domain-containing protein [Deltaproteobacteria bacterium]